MQLTALFLLAAGLAASASGFSQKVTLSERDAPLEKVFQEIKQQTGYEFLYTDEMLRPTGRITINLKDADLTVALAACFRNQPLTYAIIDQTIVVKVKTEVPETISPDTSRRGVTITGRVVDEKGEVLAGASVETKNGKKATVTDAKGMFELKNVSIGSILVLSYTGYQKKEIEVDKADLQTVVLVVANNQLDQVQVIAYGTTTERISTGDITTITSKEIEQQPVSNPLLAMEGRVPGLFITQVSGVAGSGININIQGQNSIGNGNDPFYVIDGVPYTSQLLFNLGGVLGYSSSGNLSNSSYGSPLSYINPSDIESISVLKDADATAIYGSQASNGAILITTKKGIAGQTKFDLNLQQGQGQVARKLNLLNTPEYLTMRHEANNNDDQFTQSSDYDINGLWDTTRNTDWQKTLIGATAQYTNLNATISGGNLVTQYLVGATYRKETSVFPGDFADQSGSLHFSITSVSSDRKFHFQLSGNYLLADNELPSADLTGTAITLPPDAPPLYNKDGSLNWMPNASGASTYSPNPLAYTLNTYSNRTNNLVSNAVLSYQVLPGLEIRSSFGYTNMQMNETAIFPLIAVQPENRPFNQRTGDFGNNNIHSWIIEPQLSYKSAIGKGRLEALIGSTIQQENSNGLQLVGAGYNSDLVIADIHSAASVITGYSVASVYKYNALFGRLNYIWDEKYLANLTVRRDGSSRFGSANQFHDFEAAGIGWIFSKESFVQNVCPFLSFGKIRASYGTTGNDQIGNYQFLSLYNPSNIPVPYQQVVSLQPTNLPSPYIQWEETRKAEAGLDLGFLKDRILLNTVYFENRSSNQLLNYVLPVITGFPNVLKNFPATVQNTGWEFTLSTTNIKVKDFTWITRVNLTFAQNKLLAFPNLASSSYASQLIVGQPLNVQRLFHWQGVNDTTGIYQFASKSGATSNPNYPSDATELFNPNPKYYGGLENSFRYKGFTLDFLFAFTKRKGSNYFFGFDPGVPLYNQPVSVLNRWQKPGDKAPIQQYDANYNLFTQWSEAAQLSDAAFSDASFIRLKNLSLAWEFPQMLIKKAHLQTARIYLQGQNLLTITKYSGMDPENLGNALPPLRMLTAGVEVGL